jgi:hypothetical protein
VRPTRAFARRRASRPRFLAPSSARNSRSVSKCTGRSCGGGPLNRTFRAKRGRSLGQT